MSAGTHETYCLDCGEMYNTDCGHKCPKPGAGEGLRRIGGSAGALVEYGEVAALAARLAALEQQHAADERALRMAREALVKIAGVKGFDVNFQPAADMMRYVAECALAALPEPPTDAK